MRKESSLKGSCVPRVRPKMAKNHRKTRVLTHRMTGLGAVFWVTASYLEVDPHLPVSCSFLVVLIVLLVVS